jgi:hypothetical protein
MCSWQDGWHGIYLVFLFVRRVLGLVDLGPRPDDKDVARSPSCATSWRFGPVRLPAPLRTN